MSDLGPVTCIVCGKSDARAAFLSWDRQHEGPGSFVVRRCSNCGTYFVSPQPPKGALGQYYPADYAPYVGLSLPGIDRIRNILVSAEESSGSRVSCAHALYAEVVDEPAVSTRGVTHLRM